MIFLNIALGSKSNFKCPPGKWARIEISDDEEYFGHFTSIFCVTVKGAREVVFYRDSQSTSKVYQVEVVCILFACV